MTGVEGGENEGGGGGGGGGGVEVAGGVGSGVCGKGCG